MISVNCSPTIDPDLTLALLGEIRTDPLGGWLDLPRRTDMGELSRIKDAAQKIQEESEVLVCIGIGGSYLGHRAVIEALAMRPALDIIFAGNSLSSRALTHAIAKLGDRDFSIVVISKSGTTLEPTLAFNQFRDKLLEKYGAAGASERIYVITDPTYGALHDEAIANHYTSFAVPSNLGGRFSVLSSVGLLPLATMGIDIDSLLAGAATEAEAIAADVPNSPAAKYAWTRFALSSHNYDTEVFASFEPFTWAFLEWLKQLFGESEGKNGHGVWPASVIYSTDLHSLGQFMQDGRRNLWETIINFPTDELNEKALHAVAKAHTEGGLPVLEISVPSFDAKGFGALLYFFEFSCALSAKLMGVNPFDQPGVERYKQLLN